MLTNYVTLGSVLVYRLQAVVASTMSHKVIMIIDGVVLSCQNCRKHQRGTVCCVEPSPVGVNATHFCFLIVCINPLICTTVAIFRDSVVKTLRNSLGLGTVFLPAGCDDSQAPCKVTKTLKAAAKRLVGQAYDDLAAVQEFWNYFRPTDSVLCLGTSVAG
jgi:hypothetical protein